MLVKQLKPYSVLKTKSKSPFYPDTVYVCHINYMDERIYLCQDPELHDIIGSVTFEQLDQDYVSEVTARVTGWFRDE